MAWFSRRKGETVQLWLSEGILAPYGQAYEVMRSPWTMERLSAKAESHRPSESDALLEAQYSRILGVPTHEPLLAWGQVVLRFIAPKVDPNPHIASAVVTHERFVAWWQINKKAPIISFEARFSDLVKRDGAAAFGPVAADDEMRGWDGRWYPWADSRMTGMQFDWRTGPIRAAIGAHMVVCSSDEDARANRRSAELNQVLQAKVF